MDVSSESVAETFVFHGLTLVSAWDASGVVKFTVVQLHHFSNLLRRGDIFDIVLCGKRHHRVLFRTVARWHIEDVLRVFSLYCNAVDCRTVCTVFPFVEAHRTNDCPTELILFSPRLIICAVDDAQRLESGRNITAN